MLTRDAGEATAYMAQNIRPGLVRPRRPQVDIGFHADYFVDRDFMAGLMRVSPGWDFMPLNELDAVLVWLGLDGKITIQNAAAQASSSRDNILMTSARTTNRIFADEPYQGFVLAVCSEAVRQELSGFLGYRVETPFDFLTQTGSHSRFGSALTTLGAALHAGLAGDSLLLSSPIGLRRHRDAFVGLMLLTAGADKVAEWGGPGQPASAREVRRAEDFIRARAMDPIGVGDVAAHVGVSVRTLQYAFRRHRDATPLAMLQKARLDGVRLDLQKSETGRVAAVAARWGFTHLGRFSRQYQAAFGEKPSQTAMRRSGTAG